MKKQHIIFDFDGTLWDSFWLAVKALATFAPYFWYKSITSPEEIEALRKMTPQEILGYIQIAKRKIPFVALVAKMYMKLHKTDVSLFEWTAATIKKLHGE